jgi:hypothetical protein
VIVLFEDLSYRQVVALREQLQMQLDGALDQDPPDLELVRELAACLRLVREHLRTLEKTQ